MTARPDPAALAREGRELRGEIRAFLTDGRVATLTQLAEHGLRLLTKSAVLIDTLLAALEAQGATPDLDARCTAAHDAYEVEAARVGWATNPASRVAWADLPEANKAAMRAAIRAALEAQGASEPARHAFVDHEQFYNYCAHKRDALRVCGQPRSAPCHSEEG
jgi:hypothetical protein